MAEMNREKMENEQHAPQASDVMAQLERLPEISDGLLLTYDATLSTRQYLRITSHPIKCCGGRWLDIPLTCVESIRLATITKYRERFLHVLFVRFKPEFKSLITVFRAALAPPDAQNRKSRLVPWEIVFASQADGTKLAVWTNDQWNVGDCAMQAGASVRLYPDGHGTFVGYIKSSDTNDEWKVQLYFYDHEDNDIPMADSAATYLSYSMDGDSCTNKWCLWEQSFPFPADQFNNVNGVLREGQC